MNDKQKIKILNHVLEKLNKKFCKNKLSISKIVFFDKIPNKKKSCKVIQGYYDFNKKEIGIKKDISFIEQIDNLCHEITHSIIQEKGHNKKGWKLYQRLLKETDKILEVKVK